MKIDKAKFIEQCVESNECIIEEFHDYFEVVSCNCKYENCEGWQLITKENAFEKLRDKVLNNNLKIKLNKLGFKSVLIEEDNLNNIYVKVWFNFEMNGKIHSDGRHEFCDIGNSEETLNYIIKWIDDKEKGFKVIL